MSHSTSSQLVLKNPLLSLLQRSKTTSDIFQIHAQLVTNSLISDTFAVSRLIVALTSNALSMDYAEIVFSQVQEPHAFIWNSMIRGFVKSSNPRKALVFFDRMKADGVSGDNYTYTFALKACGLMMALEKGREIHGELVKKGFDVNLVVRNCLMNMYCKCGKMVLARTLFDGFEDRDLVSWNSIISGYVDCGEMDEAQKLFDEMPERDMFSWAMMIDGYGKKVGCVARARQLFNDMPTCDLVCWNSMIDAYVSLGELDDAHELFREMPNKNVITWSIMINGYVQHGNPKKALGLFVEMLAQGTKPDKVSVVGVIQGCAQLGALDQGRWIHIYMEKNKIATDLVVQTALMDMYMKCGCANEAQRIFDSMLERNVVSWNVMIVGLGINGQGEKALELFYQMERLGIPMDDLTFLGVLSACNHAGLVTECLRIFERMKDTYGIEPRDEHYSCLVDLLGRAGKLSEAKDVIATLPIQSGAVLWSSLLAACKMHQNCSLVEVSMKKLLELKADDSAVYVLLSSIYAEDGMWENVFKTRKMLSDQKMKKEIGRSVIEVNGGVCEFFNNDKSLCLGEEMHLVIWSLSRTLVSAL